MPDTLDLDTLTAAATEAASRGDAVAAASLLRLALDQQVSALGPDHRDLAPTLNNLAMMLERQGEAAEAERCYRRAYDVARRGAPPDDPVVKVSRANLVAFLQASGVADPVVDAPPDPPAAPPSMAAVPPPTPPIAPATSPPPSRPPRAASAPTPSQAAKRGPAPEVAKPVAPRSNRRWRFAVAIVAGALAGAVAGWLLIESRASDTPGEPVPNSTSAPIEQAPAPVRPDESPSAPSGAAAPPPAPSNPTPPAPRPSDPGAPTPAAPPVAPRAQAPDATSRRAEGATISADGRICATLARGGGAWRCDPAGDPTAADGVYYYTRVRSARDVAVSHRWSHQGQVIRTVRLEVRANPQEGFRTFSRQSLGGRNGAWEVALIAPDGTIVDTQRFTVERK